MEIKDAQYGNDDQGKKLYIKATIDGVECFVALDENNRHYDEIMKQVDAGTLTIKDAE